LRLKEVNCIEPEVLAESILKNRIDAFINQWNEYKENEENIKLLEIDTDWQQFSEIYLPMTKKKRERSI
jgi:hypothetical protein